MIHAYAAGIIDGEGSVMIINRTTPTISVSNTSRPILEFLKENYGGHIKVQKKYKQHHKDCWVWNLLHDKALLMLENILPFMLEEKKVHRATILVEEWKLRTPRNGKYSPQQLEEKEEMLDRYFGDALVFDRTLQV